MLRQVLVMLCLAAMMFGQAPRSVVKITGSLHHLVLFSDGTVGGWGDTRDGQLGPIADIKTVRGHTAAYVPIAIPGKAVDIAATDRVSYVLLSGGTVLAFGWGHEGGLGCGQDCSAGKQERPTPIPGLRDVAQIAAGNKVAFAIHRDGSVSAWGNSAGGMLGDGLKWQACCPAPVVRTPVQVPKLSGVKQISVGNQVVLAVTAQGHVLSWGIAGPALGRAAELEDWVEPGEVPGLTDVTTVISGTAGAALKTDGTVWVWGSNMNGGLGNGRADSSVAKVPVRVPGLANVAALSGAPLGRHFVALLKDGTLRTWGNSDWGQGGVGISGTNQAAVSMPKLTGVKAAFAAGNNTFAVREDGSAWIWGVGHKWPEGPEWPLGEEATKTPRALLLPN